MTDDARDALRAKAEQFLRGRIVSVTRWTGHSDTPPLSAQTSYVFNENPADLMAAFAQEMLNARAAQGFTPAAVVEARIALLPPGLLDRAREFWFRWWPENKGVAMWVALAEFALQATAATHDRAEAAESALAAVQAELQQAKEERLLPTQESIDARWPQEPPNPGSIPRDLPEVERANYRHCSACGQTYVLPLESHGVNCVRAYAMQHSAGVLTTQIRATLEWRRRAEQAEADLAALRERYDAVVAERDDLFAQCAEYLKDDETPAECIARNRKDIDALMTVLAQRTEERDRLLPLAKRSIEGEHLNRTVPYPELDHPARKGHRHSFNACPHPDCRLVRSIAGRQE